MHTADVARRVTAATFVGREDELRRLAAAADDAHHGGQLVVLGGDAGIGKTRLLAEACARHRTSGGLAVVGGCVDVGSGGAGYAPLIEVLRQLRVELGAELEEVLARDAPDLVPLVDRGTQGREVPQGAVLAQTVALLGWLGERSPGSMIVFEDLHWADASTHDLVRYLARNLPAVDVVLVLTYRTDDLHRRHPLRPLLSELQRAPEVEQLALAGMTRSELTMLLAAVTGSVPPDAVVDEVLARSEGNPFYAEELLAARAASEPMPSTVRDAILGRVARLEDPTPAILREAALLGDDIDARLLAAVTGRAVDDVSEALHEAVAHQILTAEPDRCRFRHALVREAMYDDLLPGERQRLHEVAAGVIETRADLLGATDHVRWALLAHHWTAADDQPNAFRASVRAAAAADAVGALADAAHHYRRACQLWSRVPDATAAAGMDQPELLARASASVGHAGAPGEAVSLVEQALDLLDTEVDPERRAALLLRLGEHRWAACDADGSGEARAAAAALVAGRPATEQQALTLCALGRWEMLVDRFRDAEVTLGRALDAAALVGSDVARAEALTALGFVLVKRGRPDEGVAAGIEALELATGVGAPDEQGRAHIMLTATLLAASRFEEAADRALDGLEHARRAGMLAFDGVLLAYNRAYGLWALGRWDDAAELVGDDLDDSAVNQPFGTTGLVLAARIAHARGDTGSAARHVARSLASPDSGGRVSPEVLAVAAILAAGEGRYAEARAQYSLALEAAEASEDLSLVLSVGAAATEIEAEAAEAAGLGGPGRRADVAAAQAACDAVLDRCERVVASGVEHGAALSPEAAAHLATAEAARERAWGRHHPDQWAEVGARWDALGCVHPAAVARLREADAVLRTRGNRDRAARAARRALATAEELGAAPLADEIRLLAQRGRLDLAAPPAEPEPAADPVGALGISARERQVLGLLAVGQTNRQIADALYISDKTASVHVTHLLRKLGVASRVEAAAIGQRLGLGAGDAD